MTEPFSPFLFMCTQRGSVDVLKREVAARFPDFRFSYSRGGFLTWRVGESLSEERKIRLNARSLRLVFSRCAIHSLGKIGGKGYSGDLSALREDLRQLVSTFPKERFGPFRRIHVWEPDAEACGARGFEPGVTSEARELRQSLLPLFPTAEPEAEAAEGDLCFDLVILDPKEWWIGFHFASDFHSRYPGGLVPLELPTDAASRAWLKFEEGLRWSGFPIQIGSRCADIGASPGGGSQTLLARGAEVLGVDPAEIAPQVLQNPNFTHLRGKIGQLKRKNFLKTRWVITDMNVAPSYTLDVLEELLSSGENRENIPPAPNVRGALFTLKLFNLDLAREIPDYIRRVKSWGFNRVSVRQLTFNRREVMVSALKKPFHLEIR